MNQLHAAIGLSTILLLLGSISAYFQLRGQRALRERKHVPSDEYQYLRGRFRRRLLAAGLMILAGGMIAGTYLTGMESTAENLQAPRGEDGARQPIADQDKNFLRLYGIYWIVVTLLAFALILVAMADAWASRRYWAGVYKTIKEEHQVKLRRDLAVYQQQRDDRGAKRGKL